MDVVSARDTEAVARALVRMSLFSTVKETLVWSQRGAEATFGGVSGVQPLR